MRICLISREYPPETGFGGIATFTRHLALGLSSLGHDVEVISLAKEKARSYVEDGIKIHRVEPFLYKSQLLCINLAMPYSRYLLGTTSGLWRKFVELHNQNPFDVIDTPELLAEGIFPAVTRVAPLVIRLYTPHSKFISEKLHNVTANFDHQFVAMAERIAMLSADVITSPSDDLADFVASDLAYKRESICIVRNPIDTGYFTPEGDCALPALATGKLRVLFVGRLEERKGITYLVDAIPEIVKTCPNVEFVIIGDDTQTAVGQTSVLAKLKQTLASGGASSHVTFIDRVPLDSLPSYYRSADISIVPSVYDNSPYTCLEAMSCGRVVIGSSAGGTKEYIQDGVSGIVIPSRDSKAIADAVIKLAKDENERNRLATNARQAAIEKFDRKEIARQTAALYELARENFKQEKASGSHKGLYLHSFNQALLDAESLLDAMDKMIYDLLYQHSYRFRVSHWFHFLKDRPKLFVAKLLSKSSRVVLKLFGTKEDRYPQALRQLEAEIALKEKEHLP